MAKSKKVKIIISKKTKKRSSSTYKYYAEAEFIPETYLQQQFKSRGNWTRITRDKLKTTPDLDYIYVDGKCLLDKIHYGVKTKLKNIISGKGDIISDKAKFIRQMALHPKSKGFVQETVNIDMLDIANNPKLLADKYNKLFANPVPRDWDSSPVSTVYIFKPISGYGGAGIQRFNSFEAFSKYCQKIISSWTSKWQDIKNPHRDFYRHWQLQQYITNPLLIRMKPDNRLYKFHIRMFYIYRPGDKKSFYLKRGLMATALKPYFNGNWHDKKIHDTHFYGRIGESFPGALKLSQVKLDDIYRQLDVVFSEIDKILKKARVGCFPESNNCFHLFGADIMLTRDYKVKILEVNGSPGLFYNDSPILPAELKSVVENIMDQVVDDYFPPKHKPANPYAEDVIYLD